VRSPGSPERRGHLLKQRRSGLRKPQTSRSGHARASEDAARRREDGSAGAFAVGAEPEAESLGAAAVRRRAAQLNAGLPQGRSDRRAGGGVLTAESFAAFYLAMAADVRVGPERVTSNDHLRSYRRARGAARGPIRRRQPAKQQNMQRHLW
jgi:hypothetical protein